MRNIISQWLSSRSRKSSLFRRIVVISCLAALIFLLPLLRTRSQGTPLTYLTIIQMPFPTATPTPTPIAEWSTYIVDANVTADISAPSRYLMTDHALRIDPSGTAHVAYFRSGLYYATFNGSAWTSTVVDSAATSGKFPSLVIDSSGTPHISYYDDGNNHLRYAVWNGTTWDKVTVDTTSADTGQYTSIAVDSSGLPRIAYYDATNKSLRYVVKSANGWGTPVNLETNGCSYSIPGAYYDSISLAVNSQGWARIAYHDACPGTNNLEYLWWNGTNWQQETIDMMGNLGVYSSLVLDSNGYPRISYMYDSDLLSFSDDDLKYIYWDGASWTKYSIDTLYDVGGYTSIAIDSDDRVHIAYFDYSSQNLKYARYTGNGWEIKTIDSAGDVGYYAAIALDSNNLPQIVYYDNTNKDLKYIRRNYVP